MRIVKEKKAEKDNRRSRKEKERVIEKE